MREAALQATKIAEADDQSIGEVEILALERCFEIIGEAANRLGQEFHDSHPQLPWAQMVGMRNVIIHGYDHVVTETLLVTARKNLRSLVQQVDELLSK